MQPTPNKIENRNSLRRKTEAPTTCVQGAAENRPHDVACLKDSDDLAILDDIVAPGDTTLADHDLRLIEALQAVLEARRVDNSIKKMTAQISDELNWE